MSHGGIEAPIYLYEHCSAASVLLTAIQVHFPAKAGKSLLPLLRCRLLRRVYCNMQCAGLGTPAGAGSRDNRWPWSKPSRFMVRRSGCATGSLHGAGKTHNIGDYELLPSAKGTGEFYLQLP